MPVRDLPDNPIALQALLDEVKSYLDTHEPFLTRANLLRAELKGAEKAGGLTSEKQAYVDALRVNLHQEVAGLVHRLNLAYHFMSEDELGRIEAAHRTLERLNRARELAPPALIGKAITWSIDETPIGATVTAVRRIYSEVLLKLASGPPERIPESNNVTSTIDFPGERTVTEAPSIGPTVSNGVGQGRPITKKKEPSSDDFMLYRLHKIAGMNQESTAKTFMRETGKSCDQSKVSRACKAVKEWIGDGNTLPPISSGGRQISVDPRRLEQGPRRDKGRHED